MFPLNYFISFSAGAISVLAFAPFDFVFLPILTVAVLFYLWQDVAANEAAKIGYFFGLGLMGFGVFWLHISIAQFGGIVLPVAMLLALLFAAFLALFYALAGWLSVLFSQIFKLSLSLKLLLVYPVFWVIAELSRAYLWSGFPWLSLGYSQLDSPLVLWAPILGVFGVSWLVAFLASLLVMLFIGRTHHRLIALALLVVLATSLYWLSGIQWSQVNSEKMRVRMIQLNIPQEIKWQPAYLDRTIARYSEETLNQQADLIIWPETAVPAFSYVVQESLIEPMRQYMQENDQTLVLGIPIKADDGGYYNGMLSLDARYQEYHKRHLVPFGEFAPLDFLLRPLIDYFNIPLSDFRQGDDEIHSLGIGSKIAGVSICYEDAFGHEVVKALPQADYLINISNDAWFGDSLAPHQHLQIARMRAVENARFLLRSTNTGISAIIDAKGKVNLRSSYGEEMFLEGDFWSMQGKTPYMRFADTLIIAFVMMNLLLAIVIRFCCVHPLQKGEVVRS